MSEPNYRLLTSKQRKQHYMSVLIERLSGKKSEEIASSLKMTVESVDRDLEYVRKNWSPIFSSGYEKEESRIPKDAPLSVLRIKADCHICGATIAATEDRVVVAVIEVVEEIDDRDGDANYKCSGKTVQRGSGGIIDAAWGKRRFLHCCEKCSVTVREFNIPNPTFSEAGISSKGRSSEVQLGMELPTAEKLARPEVTDDPIHAGAFASGEDAQRAQLKTFLNDPRSRGMRPEMRSVARMWVDGLSGSEVARRLGKDQSTVSRTITAARNMAYASR